MICIFEHDFEAMLRQYNNSIDDRRQFTAIVKDIFPEEAKSINLILMAYNIGIVQDIQKADLLNNTFAFRYVKQLMDDYGISRVNADWIVSVWCTCYGNKVLGNHIQSSEKGFDKTYRYLTAITPYTDACELQFGSKTYNMYVEGKCLCPQKWVGILLRKTQEACMKSGAINIDRYAGGEPAEQFDFL